MWIRMYDGKRAETSARNPESLTVLAPALLQDECRRRGGKNLYGNPLFRVVLLSSRFQIIGGHEFLFLDSNGNYQKTCPAEMFAPRYLVPRDTWEMYLLEMWRPVEWYFENGWGGTWAMEYNAAGEGIRTQEPVWPEGGYEALWWDFGKPFVFARHVALEGGPEGIGSIRWALWTALQAIGAQREMHWKRRALEQERDQRERAEQKELEVGREICREAKSNLFLEPAISMAGAYKEQTRERDTSL